MAVGGDLGPLWDFLHRQSKAETVFFVTSQPKPRRRGSPDWPPFDQSPQVRFKTFPEVVGNHIVMRGQGAEYLEDLVARHGGELDRNPYDELFLNSQDAETLLGLAAPIYFRVNGREWVLNHNERTGWVLCTGL